MQQRVDRVTQEAGEGRTQQRFLSPGTNNNNFKRKANTNNNFVSKYYVKLQRGSEKRLEQYSGHIHQSVIQMVR